MRDVQVSSHIFCACEIIAKSLNPASDRMRRWGQNTRRHTRATRNFMDEQVQKSCWGVTAWVVLLAGGALALMYVFGGDVTPATVAIAN